MINHLGIILDGNRRRAKENNLPSLAGHKAGADNLKTITKIANDKGIKYLTVWGLSTENLQKRSKIEIAGIIKIINNAEKLLGDLIKNNVKINIIGDINQLPKKSIEVLNKLVEKTKNNKAIILTIALVYGGTDEIIRGIKKFVKEGGDIDNLNSINFRNYLDTGNLPYPDVIVRTGGDIRHSGFLLYDSAYCEYYFTKKNWPEFDEIELDKVIDFYKLCNRNFGK